MYGLGPGLESDPLCFFSLNNMMRPKTGKKSRCLGPGLSLPKHVNLQYTHKASTFSQKRELLRGLMKISCMKSERIVMHVCLALQKLPFIFPKDTDVTEILFYGIPWLRVRPIWRLGGLTVGGLNRMFYSLQLMDCCFLTPISQLAAVQDCAGLGTVMPQHMGPGASECDFLWTQSLHRCNSVSRDEVALG